MPGLPPASTSGLSMARVYDLWLGGTAALPAEQEQADAMTRLFPGTASMARGNRQFIARAIVYALSLGVAQFLDLGAGWPVPVARQIPAAGGGTIRIEGTQDTARAGDPGARVVLVDNDPVAVAHASAVFARDPGIGVTGADARDHETVLASPAVRALIDLDRPVCLIAGCLAHFMAAPEVRAMTAGYIRRIAPGSVMALSCVRNDSPDLMDRARRTLRPAAVLHNHTREEIAGFFAGLDLVDPPCVTLARGWRAGMPAAAAVTPRGVVYALAGVAIKP